MTRFLKVVLVSIFACLLIGCKSNEQKAEALIKEYMFKNLYDFDSYEAVETIIDSAYYSPKLNQQVMSLALDAVEKYKASKEHEKKLEDARREMSIWNGGWSSSSRREYDKARKTALKELIKCEEAERDWAEDILQISELIKTLPEDFVGWNVNHRFRCNTRGGNKSLGDYLFVMDEKIKTIIQVFDLDDNDFKDAMTNIGAAQSSEVELLRDVPAKLNEQIEGLNEALRKIE